jgi:hypothetical protein
VKISRLLGKWISEFRWNYSEFVLKTFFSRRANEQLLQFRIALLRKLLQKAPYWTRGHLLLGENEVLFIILKDERPAPRSIGTIEESGHAALKLSIPRGSTVGIPRSGFTVRGRNLIAFASYFRREYESCLSEFRHVLAVNNAVLLSQDQVYLSLEYAGAAALAAGQNHTALEFFMRIPRNKRTATIDSALEYISAKE